MEEDKYSVWVGAVEVNDYYLSKEEAVKQYRWVINEGYEDVFIEYVIDR